MKRLPRSVLARLGLVAAMTVAAAPASAKPPPPPAKQTPAPRPSLAAKLPPMPPKKADPKPDAGKDGKDKPAPVNDPSTEAYRMKMVANIAQAGKSATALGTLAKRNAPANMTADQKKAWDAQTKLLNDYSAKLAGVKTKMEGVLAKPKPSVSELAATNFELKQLEESLTEESSKLVNAGAAVKDRHQATVEAFKS